MEKNQKIYVINFMDVPYGKHYEELTNEEWIALSNGWCFNSWEEFVNTFNNDANNCPVSDSQYLRVI